MQQKSENFSEYSERTENLASVLSLKLNDLPNVIGISAAMFYAYRTGKNQISFKAWRKLEEAEKRAGIETPFERHLLSIRAASAAATEAGGTLEQQQEMFNSLLSEMQEMETNLAKMKQKILTLQHSQNQNQFQSQSQ